ncbi:MAG: hypothetical protein D6772_06605 [Bacteroidetes bacterium]|nr:MAG: hypothetical protein D6772_06605 [Bacteroidota bacterium]
MAKAAQRSAEAGTGYFQLKWDAEAISPSLASVEVRNPNKVPAWGGFYWQYFSPIEDIDTAKDTPLQIERKLYTRTHTPGGEELQPVQGPLAVGDKVVVRLVVRTDRDMEFVHLKDLRPAGLEPTQVLSGYRYQGGLAYYQSTSDLATHFFFDYLPRGRYVLEYDLRVFHAGDFSGGMASLQCMYAPKFTGHSAGERLQGVARE